MGTDHPIAMVLLILICLFGIAITTKGPNLRNLELKQTRDISVQCNSDSDCPIELICKKSACRKPGLVSIHISKGSDESIQKVDCKDKLKTKKCKKLEKKGKCQDKKTWKKCMETCKKCPAATKVMITTGRPKSSATKTEVVDVVNGETCADLADFPLENYGAVGANLHGKPIVCGGGDFPAFSRKCYKFKNGKWKKFASMKEKRGYFAGVMHKNKFHVFGGYNSGARSTTELISIDGAVEYGPELPEAVQAHAITSINSTVSLLSGGSTFAAIYSTQTWYFNHDTNLFSSGQSLLQGRTGHGSATIVDKVTKTKIPMVTGGYNRVSLDSTELLINGNWQSGPALPKTLNVLSIVEIQGDAFVFGGDDYNGGYIYNSVIYQLTCSSGICSWSTLNQELNVGRSSTVAIPVQDNFCK